MGRRTTSTTKGGKFMNPTDQARKEARRRELKKNKKQRIAVRQAVIKTKNPYQMLRELEDLDDMELDPTFESQYNEKVIKDKRRKLLETIIRIVEFYFKEDVAKGNDLKSKFETYKLNRAKKEMYYESVRNAQQVEINNIPLPDAPFETPHLSDIPLPGIMPAGILKKVPPGPPIGLPPTLQTTKKLPPGPPPGVPPAKKVFGKGVKPHNVRSIPLPQSMPAAMESKDTELNDEDPYDPEQEPDLLEDDGEKFHLPPDLDDDDDDEEFHHRDDDDEDLLNDRDSSDDEAQASRKRSVRFADDGDAADDDEGDGGEKLTSTVTPLQAMMLKLAGQKIPAKPDGPPDQEDDFDDDEEPMDDDDAENDSRPKPPGPPPGLPPGPPPGMPPAMMGRPGMLPPGPPPGRPPTMPMNMGPRMMGRPEPDPGMRMMSNPNILSAPPSLIHRPSDKEVDDAPAATITAKPKLTTTTKVDSTRFMPTSLRVRRETKGRAGGTAPSTSTTSAEKNTHERKKKQTASTADAAYDSFMKEMQGLL